MAHGLPSITETKRQNHFAEYYAFIPSQFPLEMNFLCRRKPEARLSKESHAERSRSGEPFCIFILVIGGGPQHPDPFAQNF